MELYDITVLLFGILACLITERIFVQRKYNDMRKSINKLGWELFYQRAVLGDNVVDPLKYVRVEALTNLTKSKHNEIQELKDTISSRDGLITSINTALTKIMNEMKKSPNPNDYWGYVFKQEELSDKIFKLLVKVNNNINKITDPVDDLKISIDKYEYKRYLMYELAMLQHDLEGLKTYSIDPRSSVAKAEQRIVEIKKKLYDLETELCKGAEQNDQ